MSSGEQALLGRIYLLLSFDRTEATSQKSTQLLSNESKNTILPFAFSPWTGKDFW
jgi:hypothetical protein